MSLNNKNTVQSLVKNWKFKEKKSNKWLNATVPSAVHLDLLKNRIIKDPFVGSNEIDLQWISDTDWHYKLVFKPDSSLLNKEQIKLKFYGLDTYAEVFLNGKQILSANNMFRAWEIDVKDQLRKGNNELIVKFLSPITSALPLMEKKDYVLPADNDKVKMTSPFTRKAPYHYGWDWGPSFATSGIWQPVELYAYDCFKIKDFYLEQKSVREKCAKINIKTIIESTTKCRVELSISEPISKINITKLIDLSPGHNEFSRMIEIMNPKLWWPVGHGQQNMYDFTVIVKKDSYEETTKKRIGLREFSVEQKKDNRGASFTFVINGKAIFAKGANWIPADSFSTRLSKKDYSNLLDSAIDANMNTLRVWGGGIYESDDFYDLCDEKGLIIWQDFMFACTLYPGDDEFLDNVKIEAEYQVTRLRNHPSIGLWCGNNEIAWAWHNWGWKDRFPKELYLKDYKALFHDVLSSVCMKLDADRLYWPSSPGDDNLLPETGQQYGSGDNHFWGVWHSGDDFTGFEKNIGRFMSEFGMQSFPEMKTINYFCKPEDQSIDSGVIKQHQKASLGNDNVLKYILMYFKSPKNFSSFVMSSQIMAGEAIKVAVEAHRRNMPYCMGSLYWQLNDCWPGASWSSLDYFGNWKALHYYAKEFFKPLLISIENKENYINVFVVNDGDSIKNSTVAIEIRDFSGELLYNHEFSVDVKPNTSEKVFTEKKKGIVPKNKLNEVLLRAKMIFENEIICHNDYIFDRPKNLKIPKQDFFTTVEKSGDIYFIKIQSKSFIYRFYALCSNYFGRFDMNYFNMFPGETRTIKFFPSKDMKEDFDFKPIFEFNSVEGLSN